MNSLPKLCLRLAIMAFALASVACSSPRKQRTVYLDGFTIVAITLGPLHTRTENAKSRLQANTLSGSKIYSSDTTVIKSNTHQIPNRIGEGFNVAAIILGLPDGKNDLFFELDHPPFQIPGKGLKTQFSRVDKVTSKNSKALWEFGYNFDHPYEQTPGIWNFRVKYRDQIIFRQSLTVIPSSNR